MTMVDTAGPVARPGQAQDVVRLVSELVVTRNQLMDSSRRGADPAINHAVSALDRLTTDLRDRVTDLQTVRFGDITGDLAGAVADAVGHSGTVRVQGGDTAVGVDVASGIREHVEAAAVQLLTVAPGADLEVCASRAGGRIVVDTVADLLTARPGTRRAVTGHPAGRQVDVLALPPVPGGTVGVVQEPSATGTHHRVRLTVPAVSTIIPALRVTAGGSRFAAPSSAVQQIIAVGDGRTALESVAGSPVLRTPAGLLPVVRLQTWVGGVDDPTEHVSCWRGAVVVLAVGERRCGLLVDTAPGTEDVVLAALPDALAGDDRYTGAAVAGDGQLTFVLDADTVVAALGTERASGDDPGAGALLGAGDLGGRRGRSVLTVRADGQRIVVPLAGVQHVVLVPADRVDRVGARPVAHIGDQLLPLVHLLGGPVLDDAHVGPFVVVVLEHGGRTVAAVVDEVIDVSDSEPPAMLDTTDGGPVACAGLVQGRITSLLDVRAAVLAADPAWPLLGIDGCGDRGVVGVTSWTNS